MCFFSFLRDLLSQIVDIGSFRNSVTSYLSPPMGNCVLSYFHKDTNDICVSCGSLLLSHPFKVACWDGGNWADNLQQPHLPTSWNCHLKPPSPQAAISQLLSTAGPVELGFYSSTQDFPDRQPFQQPTLRATQQSETPPTQTYFLPFSCYRCHINIVV